MRTSAGLEPDAYEMVVRPNLDEVQLSVFGSRTGESSVLHLGQDEWVVVDSFMDRGVPVAKRFLDKIDVHDPSIKLIVLTHFHADHFRGIRELADAYPSATVLIPGVLTDGDWRDIVSRAQRATSNVLNDSDIRKVAKILLDIDPARVRGVAINEQIAEVDGRLRTVGPATEFGRQTGLSLLEPAPGALDLTSDAVNLTSTVLYLESGQSKAILGADMNATADFGWPKILAEIPGAMLPESVGLLKVPHHGSPHAHFLGVYERLEADAVAILTPNTSGKLPDAGLSLRLAECGVRSLFITSPPRVPDEVDEPTSITANGNVGRVTATSSIGDGRWKVDCCPLAEVSSEAIRSAAE